jgi:hypothetical protein
MEFLSHPLQALSARATAGFYKRATTGGLRFPEGFLPSVRSHLERLERDMSVNGEDVQLSLGDELLRKELAA